MPERCDDSFYRAPQGIPRCLYAFIKANVSDSHCPRASVESRFFANSCLTEERSGGRRYPRPPRGIPCKRRMFHQNRDTVFPFWLRVALALIMFLCAMLGAREGFLEWAPYLGCGLYWLILVERNKTESLKEYLKKPRALASGAVLLAALVILGFRLYGQFTK